MRLNGTLAVIRCLCTPQDQDQVKKKLEQHTQVLLMNTHAARTIVRLLNTLYLKQNEIETRQHIANVLLNLQRSVHKMTDDVSISRFIASLLLAGLLDALPMLVIRLVPYYFLFAGYRLLVACPIWSCF